MPCIEFPSVVGGGDGVEMGRKRVGGGLVMTRTAALSSEFLKEDLPECGGVASLNPDSQMKCWLLSRARTQLASSGKRNE